LPPLPRATVATFHLACGWTREFAWSATALSDIVEKVGMSDGQAAQVLAALVEREWGISVNPGEDVGV
jgi:hypothetical protein